MVICGNCQASNSPKARFCVKCGTNLRPESAVTQTQPAEQVSDLKPAQEEASKQPKPVAIESRGQEESRAKLDRLLAATPGEAQIVPVSQDREPTSPAAKPDVAVAIPFSSRPPGTDVASLLEEERRLVSTQRDLEPEAEAPLHLWLNFPRALVAGYSSIIEAKIVNPGVTLLDRVDVMLESKALDGSIQATCRRVATSNPADLCVEVKPVQAGTFVLRCNVRARQQDQVYAFVGSPQITVNVVPDSSKFVFNIGDIQCVQGQANAALGGEFAPVQISNLVQPGAIRTLNDLLNLTFPESFARVALRPDYEISQADVGKLTRRPDAGWVIPKRFLAHVQSGTRLKLDPVGQSIEIPAIRLVARDEFRLGRSRTDADFLTWFWPRSQENDQRTKRVSKVHVVAETHGEQLIIRDHQSSNGATFEGHALSDEQNALIDQRGTLILGHEYHLDVTPFESTVAGGLQFANERMWSGPAAAGELGTLRGCVRFMPVNSEIALYNTLWIFTDANFGSSKVNPLVLDVPGIGEVEGRFRYYRQNFWIEDLPGGSPICVDDYKLAEREIVPLVNGARVQIGEVVFRASVEP